MNQPCSLDIIKLIEQQRESLLGTLRGILEAEPHGIREYDLLKRLEEMEFPLFVTGHHEEPLVLFRSHFLLFHLLYELRSRLHEEGCRDLEIHCLQIMITKTATPSSTDIPAIHDGLQDYYGCLDNLWNTTRDDVLDMMVKFWRHYERYCNRSDALDVFGLPEDAPLTDIKRRFRELVRKTHPDMGGSTDAFNRVMRAAASIFP